MSAPRSPLVLFAKGLLLAAAWGVALESAVLIARLGSSPHALARAGLGVRALEVASFAAIAALLLVGLTALVLPRRRRPELSVDAALSSAGLLACVCLALGFLVHPPPHASIQFTIDPLTQRLAMLGLAAALGLALLAAAILLARPGRLLAWTAGRGPLAAAAALAAIALAIAPGARNPSGAPDLILISIDTLRADRLGCYGHALPTSPALDALCGESIVYERAMAPVPETIPSYTSLLTGLPPSATGVFNNFHKAREELITLPERLREAGYLTAAVLHASFPGTFANLDQGFDLIVQRGIVARSPFYALSDALRSLRAAATSFLNQRLRRDASETTTAAVRLLRELPGEQPLFLHVYWPYPHSSYDPPARYLELVPPELNAGDERHRYDGEVRFTDVQIGRVLDAVAKHRSADDAWTVFVADHGEELGRTSPFNQEPFFGHSRFLYDSSVRVPLIVRPPRSSGVALRRDRSVVAIPALHATLLRAAGLEVPDGLEPALPLEAERPGEFAFAVMRKPHDPSYAQPLDRVSVRAEEWRLVETRLPRQAVELLRYDAAGERAVALEQHPALVARLARLLHERFPPVEDVLEDPSLDLSEAERDLLRALGYLE